MKPKISDGERRIEAPQCILSAVDNDSDGDNDPIVRFFLSLQFLLNCISLIGEHWSAPISLFDLSSINEKLAIVMLQKIKEPYDSSINEEFVVDLSSIDEEAHDIRAP